MTKAEFRVEIESPYGKQPISQWEHWMRKVADESETRWGIFIDIEREESE